MKVLLENGADVNAVEQNKATALHYAAATGYADIAKVLLLNGADVNAVDEANSHALYYTPALKKQCPSHTTTTLLWC